MPKRVKISQKELKSPDRFREAVSDAIVFLSRNYRKPLVGLGVVIAVIMGAFLLINTSERQKLEINSEFEEALKSHNEGRSQEAVDRFLAIKKEYPKAPISNIALYYAGAIKYDMGKYDDSISLLNEFLRGDVKEEPLRDAAYFIIGLSNFNKGDWQQAIDYLSKVDKGGSPYERQAKLHIGLSLEKLGRSSEAEEIYRELLGQQSGSNKGLQVK
ncbi:MAG TPA: tetratricopeptide repeat protein [Thermodesulfobacteriota bacterium]|nr:tetratricopeptide repeat protein [Thermodesulfobacteriota bacterium]